MINLINLKRVALLFLCWIQCCYMAMAQQSEAGIVVTEFKYLENDVIINSVEDSNGNPCALIKVETTQKGFKFEASSYGVTLVDESHDNEIWVYVSDKEKLLTIKHPVLGTLRNYKLNPTIRKGRVYLLKITTGESHVYVNPTVTKQYISFNVYPVNATVSVNDEPWPVDANGHTERLCNFGEYNYKVEAPNYHSTVGKIKLFSEEKKEINIRLKPAFGWLTVDDNETTRGGDLYIDNVRIGKLPMSEHTQVASGVHTVKIVKDLYKMYEHSINVTDSLILDLPARLVADFETTQLNAGEGVEIWIDDEYKGKGSWNGPLRNGTYKVTCKKENHRDISQTIHIQAGNNSPISLKSPIPIYGSLSITSSPAGATVTIDGKNEGVTPLFISRLLIGNHVVMVSKENYKTEEEKVIVKQDQEASINFEMHDFARFQISSQPSAYLYINGDYKGSTPTYFETASGTYTFKLVKKNYRTVQKEVTLNSSNPEVLFTLRRQIQKSYTLYLQPSVCMTGSVLSYGGVAGVHLNRVNLEGYYMISSDESESIYWTSEGSRPFETNYKAQMITGGRLGYNFVAGRFLRFTPQVGGQLVNYEESKGWNSFYAISATAGIRFELSFANHFGLSITPEYLYPVVKSDDYKAVSELSKTVKDFSEGFSLRGGLYFYF